MNIFVFSPDLVESARYFFEKDPRRANKQILELTQSLATVLAERGIAVPKKDGTPYKPTHKNHPVVNWLRESEVNQVWASLYLECLIGEYRARAKRQHGCTKASNLIFSELPDLTIFEPDCVPVHHGTGVPRTGDVYKDYRDYLELKLQADAEKKERV